MENLEAGGKEMNDYTYDDIFGLRHRRCSCPSQDQRPCSDHDEDCEGLNFEKCHAIDPGKGYCVMTREAG